MTRLYIFDADNTLRRTTVPGKACPHRPGEWELMPGVRERLSLIDWERAAFGVASNQDQVGYGWFTAAECHALLEDLAREATSGAARRVKVAFCPHVLEVTCDCRKPRPGLLRVLLAHFEVAPGEALFVGDAATDRDAALAAGVPFLWAAEFFGW